MFSDKKTKRIELLYKRLKLVFEAISWRVFSYYSALFLFWCRHRHLIILFSFSSCFLDFGHPIINNIIHWQPELTLIFFFSHRLALFFFFPISDCRILLTCPDQPPSMGRNRGMSLAVQGLFTLFFSPMSLVLHSSGANAQHSRLPVVPFATSTSLSGWSYLVVLLGGIR